MQEESPVRILCVFSTLDRGGAETMCMNLYRNIDRTQVQFDFVKHTNDIGAYEKEIAELGGKVYAAPKFKIYNLIEYIIWWNKHFSAHLEHRIVHGHYSTVAAVYFAIARRYGRVTIAHAHNTKPRGTGVVALLKTLFRKRIEKNSEYCFACSQEAGNRMYPKKEFKVIPNALDVKRFAYDEKTRIEQRKLLGIPENTLVLGTVANLSSVKNPNGLLDIVLSVKKRNPDVVLLWVGEGSCRAMIEERIKADGLEENVCLLGTRADVPSLLMAMDCFLLPSFNEGLPVSMIEAQTAGLMCYASDTITREADITARCRFLPLGNWEAWSDKILTDDLTHRDVSEQVKNSGYDITQSALKLQEFYMSITN